MNLDIYLGCFALSAMLTMSIRAMVLGIFLTLLDPPSRMERATLTYTEEKANR